MNVPNGHRIRPAAPEDAAAVAQIHVDGWRTTYRGVVPDAYLDALSQEKYAQNWLGRFTNPEGGQFTLVADDETGRIVGFASGGPERTGDPEFKGELYAIYVPADVQGRGIGGLLLRAFAAGLAGHGLSTMLIWALKDNPWRRFYEKQGGRLVRARRIEIGGAKLPEFGYGWPSLSALKGGS